MADPVRRSPLAHREPITSDDEALRLGERPFLSKSVLRGDAAKIGATAKTTLGAALPKPGQRAAGKACELLALGPDEWLIIADTPAPIDALSKKLAKAHHQLADVSDYYTTLCLSGAHARATLQKLTTRDLHPRALPVDSCGGMVVGHANPVVALVADAEGSCAVFDLHVRWSHADYLWCLLANAGREWGMPEQVPVHGERLVI